MSCLTKATWLPPQTVSLFTSSFPNISPRWAAAGYSSLSVCTASLCGSSAFIPGYDLGMVCDLKVYILEAGSPVRGDGTFKK